MKCLLSICRMDKYSRFKMSDKLRQELGEVDKKHELARGSGTDRSITARLQEALPQSTTGKHSFSTIV